MELSLNHSHNRLFSFASRVLRWATNPALRVERRELMRLRSFPRHTEGVTSLLGKPIRFRDAASFVSMHGEVFARQLYKFTTDSSSPRVIDGGANIGLSTIYFKQLFPHCEILAFEPDAKIAECFKENVRSFGLAGVELIEKGLWSSETVVEFVPDGADAGRIARPGETSAPQIPTVRLRDFLDRRVDLLKLDIEGAELRVLEDCSSALGMVDRLFVEYHSFEGEEQTLHRLLGILHGAGFRVHVEPCLTSPSPFVHRKVYQGMDLQLNVFAIRQ